MSEDQTVVDDQPYFKESLGYALWCLIFVGVAGVHRIYMGKYGTGILWLLTFGLFGVGQFVDLFRMRTKVLEANVREGYLPHPRYARELLRSRSSQDDKRPPPSPTQQLLNAARSNGGVLTVTQGVAATGLDFKEVQEELTEMLVAGYIDVDNEPETGVVIYRFPELLPKGGPSSA